MARKKKEPYEDIPFNTKQPTDEQMIEIVHNALEVYEGDATVMESAIGALFMGRILGWKALRVLHSNVTYHKYEKALGIRFIEVLPERTPHARMLNAVRIADAMGDFWAYITGGRVNRFEGRDMQPLSTL